MVNMMFMSKKWIYTVLVITCIAIFMKLWFFEAILKIGIRDQTALKSRNEVRDVYLKIPFPLDFKIYFFNVSNYRDVQMGAKPIVKEIGPFWYDEYKEKVDVIDNDTEDSLTYSAYDIFKFNKTKSGSLSDEDVVTIIHPMLVGMVNTVLNESPVFLSILSQAIPNIFNQPETIFVTAKVKDILFKGFQLNCTSTAFPTQAVCGQIKGKLKGLKIDENNKNIYFYSLLGSRNATKSVRIKVLRGIRNSKDLGRLIQYDKMQKIDIWSTEECNRFQGTDGWIFPPLLTPEEGLKSFSPDLCKTMTLNYVNTRKFKKISVRTYTADLGDQINNAADKCYCSKATNCSKKGIFDLNKCMNVPLYATLPHFLHTDTSYLNQIDGLEPNETNHGLKVLFEPVTGSPLQAFKRMQFNLMLQTTKKIGLFSNLPEALFPIFWIEESIELEGYFLKKLQTIFLLLFIADIVQYIFITIGVILFFGMLYVYHSNRRSISITPIMETNKIIRNVNKL